MAKFTKSNNAILPDGTRVWDTNQSMGSHRITNAQAAVHDNDYIIKSQAFTIIDTNLSLFVVASTANGDINNSGNIDGIDTNNGLSWATAFATPNQAVAYLSNKIASNNVSITVNIAEGVWRSTGSGTTAGTPIIDVDSLDLSRVRIYGSAPKAFDFTEVYELGAPVGGGPARTMYNKYFRFNIPSNPNAGGVLVGDWMFVYSYSEFDSPYPDYGMPTGGPDAWSALSSIGLMRVMEVGSTHISVQYQLFGGTRYTEDGTPYTDQNRAFNDSVNFWPVAGPNTVSGKVGILSTVFQTGIQGGDARTSGNSIHVSNSNITSINNIAAENVTVAPVGARGGIAIQNSTASLNYCTATNYARGIASFEGSVTDTQHCCASNNVVGFLSYNGGILNGQHIISTGNKTGIWVSSGASVLVISAMLMTNYQGLAVTGGSAANPSYNGYTYVYNCDYGIEPHANSAIRMTGDNGDSYGSRWNFNWNKYNGLISTGIIYFAEGSFTGALGTVSSYDTHNWAAPTPAHRYDLFGTTAGTGDGENPNKQYIVGLAI